MLVVGIVVTTRLSEEPLPATVEAIPAPLPEFQIFRFRDELRLQGHTVSQAHEKTLLEVASQSYPGVRIESDFDSLALVPEHWQDSTVQTLYAVAAADSATATLSPGKLMLRGVASDEIAWRARLSALSTALAPEVSVDEQTIAVRVLDTGTICRRAYATFTPGPINFTESTAEFRPSAFPVLQRIGALANACRDSSVNIVGHTDASGSDVANQLLSLERAEAVSDYLESLGVISDRLLVVGAGSSVPLANNETRYGRSLNRRIEIEFVPD